MSTPISQCLISKAALGDELAFKFLVEATEYNQTQVAYSYLPCECDPRCAQPTRSQLEELGRRVQVELRRRRQEWLAKHPPRPIGNFDKWVFPVIKSMRVPWWKQIWNRLRGRPATGEFDLRQIILAQPTNKNEQFLH